MFHHIPRKFLVLCFLSWRIIDSYYPPIGLLFLHACPDSVNTVAEQSTMGYTQFLGQAEHIHQPDYKITQSQWHGDQAQVSEKTGGN